ncbi:MAG: molybdopterin cofactor-binding domain-containing protein [Pseudomonadota bacterium]
MERRTFLTWTLGGGLALALPRPAHAAGPLSPWITLHPDGRVILVTTALEMGQGSRTGQAQILADELDVAWDRVSAVMAPETDPYLNDGELFSGGSYTVRSRYDLLRRAGASVRHRLVQAAAAQWGVAPAECAAAFGKVTHAPSGRSLDYGALAAAAAALPEPADPPLKPAAERRYIGKPLSTLQQGDKVNGTARFGVDFRLPGMAYATLLQCPHFGGTLESVDEAPALAIPGVRRVVRLKDAIAVVADTSWPALRGAAALRPVWRNPGTIPDSAAIAARLAASLDAPGAVISPREGGAAAREKVRAAYAAAPRRHDADYTLAYLSHSPMEPMNATARPLPGGGIEIWAPCQSPTWAREAVVELLGLPKDRIVIHPLLMGGAFGRRLKGDYAARAAELALAIDGPVHLLWSREEDMAHDFYRPAMHARFRGALDAAGMLQGYEVLAATADDLTGGSQPNPYTLPLYAATLANVKIGVPIGSWRSVDPGMMMFARESFIDECAHQAGIDSLAYRDRMLGTNERARRVLHAAAKAIGWGSPKPPGIGRGLALLHDWETHAAHAVEVEMLDGRPRVRRIVVAGDCGTAVNPQQVRAQFEGGALMGLSAALGERIDIADGRAVQRNFDRYRILRMADAPPVEVILLDTPEVPIGGAGEPPVPGVAPALANAIFDAGGKRLRSLPLG